jgi:Protein of unknown function (DUF433)
MSPYFPRITVDPALCQGKPCIRGLRIPVCVVLVDLAASQDAAQLLDELLRLSPAGRSHPVSGGSVEPAYLPRLGEKSGVGRRPPVSPFDVCHPGTAVGFGADRRARRKSWAGSLGDLVRPAGSLRRGPPGVRSEVGALSEGERVAPSVRFSSRELALRGSEPQSRARP